MTAPRVDLGEGVSIEQISCRHRELAGYIVHYSEQDYLGTVNVCPECPGPCWTIEHLEPLTLSPSIQTGIYEGSERVKNFHGFVRDGKWVWA